MEYPISTVLVMAASIVAAVGRDRDGYEANYLGGSDQSYDGQGSDQGYEQGGHGYEQGGHGKDYYSEPHYAFAYEVHDDHTGDIKAHREERKGDHTQGMYMLVEPNGSHRVVEYVVQGKSGFNAKVHQSASQASHGGHSGHTGHAGQSNTGGQPGHSGYTGDNYSGGHVSQSGYTAGPASQSSYTGGHASYTGDPQTNGLGSFASGHYTHNQSPYKVQEITPSYNYKPLISYKPTFNLQPFKPLIPYIPSDPNQPKHSFPYSKPLIALYRPQTSYKPISSNKPNSYKFIPALQAQKQSSYDNLHSQSNERHATSSISFSSHGSKIASTTNHVLAQHKRYENKH